MKVQNNLTIKLLLGLFLVLISIISVALSSGEVTLASNDVTWQLASTGLQDTGNPMAVDFGDYDNDGKLDIFAGSGSTGLYLWPNDGTPVWGEAIPLADTGPIYGLATADINQDGLLDVVASVEGRVHVYTQDYLGEWADEIPMENTGEFYQVAIGDINNDGSPDIVAANHQASGIGIEIWTNYDGFWDIWTLPNISAPVWGVALGDFNDDGRLDIAATKDGGRGGVYVWRNDPYDPAFWVPASSGLPASTNSWHGVALDDFNHDGKLDLAAASDQGLKVWMGNGSGSWTEASTGLPTSGTYLDLASGDLDNNGWFDLVSARADGLGIEPWGNTGGTWTMLSQPDSSNSWWDVTLGDVDNDGILDLGATSQSNQGVVVWVDGGVSEPAGNWLEISSPITSGTPSSIAATDLNWDGNLDFVITMEDNTGIKTWRGDGGNSWNNCDTLGYLPTYGNYGGLALGKINNDPYVDILVGNVDNNGITMYQNMGGCAWSPLWNGLPITGSYNALELGDIDQDDKPDLVGALVGGGLGTWEYNSAGFNWIAGVSPTSTSSYADLALGDVNLDGKLDIAAANKPSNVDESLGVRVWLYDTLTDPPSWDTSVVTPTGQYEAIALGDLNNDGALDIAAAKNGAPAEQGIHLWLGDGTGSSWIPFSSPETSGQYHDLDLADINNDGNLDILATKIGSGVIVWTSDGIGDWVESSTNLPTTGEFYTTIFGYIDHDGKPDLLTTQDNNGVRMWTADEATPPGSWGGVAPTGWLTYQTQVLKTSVIDSGSGLDVSTAEYGYSLDSGASWSPWLPAIISGTDGITTTQVISTTALNFGQDSGTTHLNQVRFRVADMVGNTGESPPYNVEIDSTPPTNPTTLSGDRATGAWNNDPNPTMTWSGASDASSTVRGYSYEWTTSPDSVPDQVLDTASTFASPTMPGDGQSWYFHVRTVDWAGLWNPTATTDGPYWLDNSPPENPTSFSSNPQKGYWTNDDTIYVNWSGASDGAGSGVYGYSYQWSNGGSVLPDTIVDTTGNSTTSGHLGSGLWYFNIRTRDIAGTWSPEVKTYAIFYVDVEPPSSTLTSPDTVNVGGFTVNWSGSDSGGSGYALRYDVQYFDYTTGGPWTNWKTNTTLTSGYFFAEPGHMYFFRCRARDGAGNQEAWPFLADSVTRVAMLDFQPFAIEVTQAVQDLNNSVALVANKRTFARLHVKVDGVADHGPIGAKLSAWRGSTYLGSITPNNPGGTIIVRKNPNRRYLDQTFYFDLPSSWLHGSITLTGEVNPNGRWVDTNQANDAYSVNVSFLSVPAIRVILFDVFYNHGGSTYHVDNAQRLALASWLRRIYPVPSVTATLAWMGPFSSLPSCELVNANLFWHKFFHTLGLNESWYARYYGMVSDAGAFMRGCAGGIPSVVASGPSWSGNEWYGSHELGHTYNQHHTQGTQPPPEPCGAKCGCEDGAVTHYPNGDISPTYSGPTALYGFDVQTIEVYPPWYKDNMTYCAPYWISDYTYEWIAARIITEGGSSSIQSDLAAPQDHLAVFGTIYTTTQQVNLSTFYIVPDSNEFTERVPGDYSIRLLDADGAILADYPFTPKFSHLDPGPAPSSCQLAAAEPEIPGLIAEFVPWVTGTAKIAISQGELELASRLVSLNPPQVSLTYPNGGEVLETSTFTVTWTASDLDGDSLEFALEYSVDGGNHWGSLSTGITSTQMTIDTEFLAGTDQGRFRIMASDGVNTTRDESDGDFRVPNKAPTVQIVSPLDGSRHVYGSSVALVVDTIDVEDGTLDDSALTWSASFSGTITGAAVLSETLGTGHMIHVTDLITGTHQITLTAVDTGGQQVSKTVTIHIVPEVLAYDNKIYLPLVLR